MIRLLVNAIPLTNVATGISRYLRCLYSVLEREHSCELDIWYFDGVGIRRDMPFGPENLARWAFMADVFWKLPPRVAYVVRLWVHRRRERLFQQVASGFDVYHEAGFFPFITPTGVKTVFTLHDMSISRFPEHHPRERVLFMSRFLRERTALADRILTVSEFSRNEIVSVLGASPERIDVTPLAPASVFRPVPEVEMSRLKSRLGLPERYFLFVGSGDPRKNADTIPRALEVAGLDIPLVSVGWSGWGGEC
ncbi:glycosyltransferase [Pseudodesulfovibrio tunisiensis]|uniref:glycosyltransferase n=1 Tax=Pseudodesulfovibrio tunisiensis TaxID=463192 RepID=UPI001FB37272|nr:glycosyltransferase [Pseudodesulfovibrio tunisiensis]